MPRSKNPPMTATQANLLLFEVGIVAASALLTLTQAVRGAVKIKRTAEEVKDVAHKVL